jgi:hypothetical protein
MPHVVRGIVDDVDMRKADHADDEKAERHRQETLKNDGHALAGEQRQTNGVRIVQGRLPRERRILADPALPGEP